MKWFIGILALLLVGLLVGCIGCISRAQGQQTREQEFQQWEREWQAERGFPWEEK